MDSYKSIIKSTSIIAFVQIFKIFFVFIQNKILAIVVGTAGYGVYSLYYTFSTMVSSFSTLGVDQACVRQVAKNQDNQDFGKIIYTSKFLLFFLSIVSFIIVLLFRNQISLSLFGSQEHAFGIAIIGCAIFFNGISQGFVAILNGVQKLKYIAYSQIFGVASSVLFATGFIYLYNTKGIPYFILIASVVVFLFSSYFLKKLKLPVVKPNLDFFVKESKVLLSVGAGIAYSAVIVFVSTYFSQIYIRKNFGLEWVGMYNASNIISNVYLGIILTAMGVDLIPKLAKLTEDDHETNKLVNYQIEFGLLLSTIGIIAVIAFSPEFLTLIYSSKFVPATNIIRWHIMAATLKVLSYPLSYILIVRKKTLQYVMVQTVLWGGSYLLLVVLTKKFGVIALGADFFIAFVFYIALMYFFNRKVFEPSKLCLKSLGITWFFILAVLVLNTIVSIDSWIKNVLNLIILGVNLYWTNNYLKKYMGLNVVSIVKSKITQR